MEADMDTALRQMKEAKADTPIELPVTALSKAAELLREAQRHIGTVISEEVPGVNGYELLKARDKLTYAGIFLDVARGDGE